MANVLGGAREVLPPALADVTDGGAKVHLYGKEVRPGRKVGHVTVAGEDVEELYRRAVEAAAIVRDGAPVRGRRTEKR
jgi:5-(carboxyamino)imidazole ribonucleotide synthase